MNDNPTPPTAAPAEQVKKVRIYTMPEKFHIEDKKGGGGKNTFLIVGIIFLVVLILGAGAYFAITKFAKTNDNTNTQVNLNNANIGTNANTNTNANRNANINTNANFNSNRNISIDNLNLFNNTNANANASGNINAVAIKPGQDSDSDGLSDVEEALYGTSVSFPDTDSDSFSDGQELMNGFDPNSAGKLENSSKVRLYSDTDNGYSILYPAAWVVDNDPQVARGKIFTSGEEFVSLSVEDNPSQLLARDWYLTKSPGANTAQLTSIVNWDKTLSGAKSPDGLTAYFAKGAKVYVISYNINIQTEANFLTTFTMMYKSFKLISTALTNANSNANLNANRNANTNTTTNSLFNLNTNLNQNSNGNSNSNKNTNTNINTNINTNLSSNRL